MNIQTILLFVSFIATVVVGMIVVPILKKKHLGSDVRKDGPQSHLKKEFKHKTLEERAAEFGGKLGPYEETAWGNPMGREEW